MSFRRKQRGPARGHWANRSTQKVGLPLHRRIKRITGVFFTVLDEVEKVKDMRIVWERDVCSGVVLALSMDKRPGVSDRHSELHKFDESNSAYFGRVRGRFSVKQRAFE